jgi:uncharacterized damage-inducible protein DinB
MIKESDNANPFGVPVPEWYRGYVQAMNGNDAVSVLRDLFQTTPEFLAAIPEALHNYAYSEGKWTVKEVLLHVIDAERIFAYRALRFARNDHTELSGFDENTYVPNSGASTRSMGSLISEYKSVRSATLSLFENLSEEMWIRIGKANNYEFSVRLSAVIIAGHELHHLGILRERYFKS